MDLTTYINSTNTAYTLDSTTQSEVMSRLRSVVANFNPQLSTSPSSITGRLGIVPLSQAVGMLEQALTCVLSDLNLQNAMDGIVCDCDFVEAVLKSLGVTALAEANVTGIARVRVNQNQQYTFRSSMSMLFGDQYVFNIYSAGMPEINILPANSPTPEGSVINQVKTINNTYVLSSYSYDTSSNLNNGWFVDLPIYGPASASVSNGDTASIDSSLDYYNNIVDIEMVGDVTPYISPTTLSGLLQLVRSIQPCASLTTRSGAVSYIINKFPQAVGCSPVLNGDSEISTRSVGPSGVNFDFPKMDLYVKGTTSTCTEIVPFKSGCSIQFQHSPIQFLSANYIINADTAESISSSTIRSCLQSRVNALYEAYSPWEMIVCKQTPDSTGDHSISNYFPTYNGSIYDDNVLTITNSLSGGESVTMGLSILNCSLKSNAYIDFSDIELTVNFNTADNVVNITVTDGNHIETVTLNPELITQSASAYTFTFTSTQNNLSIDTLTFNLINTSTETWNSSECLDWIKQNTQPFRATLVFANTPIEITYSFDSMVRPATLSIVNDTNYPVVSTAVKETIPVLITNFTVEYFKLSSKYVDHQAVTSSIADFLNNCIYPVTYSDAYIAEILLNNGASGIVGIQATAVVQRAVGNEVYSVGTSATVQSGIIIDSLNDISSSNITSDLDLSQPYGSRNISFYIDNSAIVLKENILR